MIDNWRITSCKFVTIEIVFLYIIPTVHWSISTPPASGSIFASNSYLIIVNVKMLFTICCWEFYMFLFWYTFLIINRFNHTVVKTHCYFTLAWLFWVSQLDWLFNIYVNNCNFDQSQIVFFWIHITTFCMIDILIFSCFKLLQLQLCRIDHYNYLYIHSSIISVTLSFFNSMLYKC